MMPVLVPNLFTQFPPMMQLFLHSGITIGTLTAIVANLTLNGSVPLRISHDVPEPDPLPPSAAARNMAVRTVRMWLLLRKVQKGQQPQHSAGNNAQPTHTGAAGAGVNDDPRRPAGHCLWGQQPF